jgi:TetR/AcrR family transcriptional repressor of nem operon
MGRPRNFDDAEAISAATRAFRVHGYGAATPQLLADAVGIGKGSLYNAFGTKHDLFITCLQRYSDDEYRALLEQLEGGSEDIRTRIRAAFEAAAAADREKGDSAGCMIVNTAVERGPADTAASEIVAQSMTRTRTAILAALRSAAAAGEIAPERNLPALADVLQCSLIGLRIVARTSHADATGLIDSVIAQI